MISTGQVLARNAFYRPSCILREGLEGIQLAEVALVHDYDTATTTNRQTYDFVIDRFDRCFSSKM